MYLGNRSKHSVFLPFLHWVTSLLLGTHPFVIFSNAQGINLSVPGFSQVFNLGKGEGKEIQDRWWFWLIIGLISALFIVIGFFTWRGVLRWRAHKKALVAESRKEQEEELQQQQQGNGRSILTVEAHLTQSSSTSEPGKDLNPAAVQVGAVELANMEEGKPKGGEVENKEDKSESRVTVERQNDKDSSWAPKYGVNWEEVQRRAGPTPQQQHRHHHRRQSRSGSTNISATMSTELV